MKLTHRLAGVVLGAAAVFLPAGSASAVECRDTSITALTAMCAYVDAATTRDGCNAAVADVSCTYCSRNGSASKSDQEHCENNEPNYAWETCTVWANNLCQLD